MKLNFPNIYVFNPTCEFAIANEKESWQPNLTLQKMESDLSVLPIYFANKGDIILVDKIPSPKFIEQLSALQIEIPDFVLKTDIKKPEFISQQKNKLLPWGWSPPMHKYLAPLKPFCSDEFKQSPVFNWLPEHRNFYSRKFALDILKQLTVEMHSEYFIPQKCIPEICTTKSEIENVLQKWGKLMVKSPWSSSGRGLQPITTTPVHPKVWEKLMAVINDQGFAVVEPLLNKTLDFAFEFKLEKGKVEFLGMSYFSTDKKGQYQGNYLNGLPDDIHREIKEFTSFCSGLILNPLTKIIENSDLALFYEGILGVDTLIYLDENKQLKINPCLEINLRFNMGWLSIQLEKLILNRKKGVFRTYYQPGKSFHQFKTEMEQQFPLKMSENKIESGFLALVDSDETTRFGAWLLV